MRLIDLKPSNRRTMRIVAAALVSGATLLLHGGCPEQPAPPPPPTVGNNFDEDTTVDTLSIATDETGTVENNAVVTVSGDATIDGTLSASTGRITLRVEGDLKINGTIRANDSSVEDLPGDTAFGQQAVGIHIVVGAGSVTLGTTAVLESNGPIVITDDDDVLTSTPTELFDNVEDVSDEELPTLVPLPPENEAFNGSADGGGAKAVQPLVQQGAAAGPIVIGGAWPPVGAPVPAGDQPVIIFQFNGMRNLMLDGWTVNGPAAPAGAGGDQSENPGDDATGQNGKNGLRLNIRNNGGPINIVNDVVLNLADGGDGGSASAVCATATGGNGAKSGNFRMTAAGGIDIMGTLTINPGRGGDGGEATVLAGEPGAGGCPGAAGEDSMATGGAGGENRKRLLVRGNVEGLANLTIGPLGGGNGGEALADACSGGDGDACCDGGPGGTANATGGKAGDALLNISGQPVSTSPVTGGAGGDAFATGGAGGNGGDCKFFDGGDGGDGGAATATGGAGGSASGGSAAIGGDGGDAIPIGGNGGAGGDSGFGDPGTGGDGGTATATAGAGGPAVTAGVPGEDIPIDGVPGPDGEALAVTLYCIPLPLFVQTEPGPIEPGPKQGPVQDTDNSTQIGSITIDFAAGQSVDYQRGEDPDHIGIGNGELDILTSSLQLESTPGVIGGLRIEPLQGNGFNQNSPLTVQALDIEGQVVGTQTFAQIPNNVGGTGDPQTLDAVFDVDDSVITFRIIAPEGTFITIVRVYLLDP